jgi:hypothetical protein
MNISVWKIIIGSKFHFAFFVLILKKWCASLYVEYLVLYFFMIIYGNPRLSTTKLDLRITVSLDRTCMQTREKLEKAGWFSVFSYVYLLAGYYCIWLIAKFKLIFEYF